MHISAIQLSYTDDDTPDTKIQRATHLVKTQTHADLIVLPELWYDMGFAYKKWGATASPIDDNPAVQALGEAARSVGSYVHAGSFIEATPEAMERIRNYGGDMTQIPDVPDSERGLWNTSVVFNPRGEIIATYRKIHRFGFGNGEPKLLAAGETVATCPIEVDGQTLTLGLATCYDLRFPELFRVLVDAGAELFLVPAAWPAARVKHWQLLAQARALEDFAAVVACNTSGFHGGVQMGGKSLIVDAAGEIIAQAGTEETILTTSLSIEDIHTHRKKFPALNDRRIVPTEVR